MNGSYEIWNDKLRKYAKAYEKPKGEFSEIILRQVRREENKMVDKLARMTNALTSWTSQDMVLQVKLRPQIHSAEIGESLTLDSIDWQLDLLTFLRREELPLDEDKLRGHLKASLLVCLNWWNSI